MLIPTFCHDIHIVPYSELCIKCLHPIDRHAYVVARTDGKEVRRCEIGQCPCVVMMAPSK